MLHVPLDVQVLVLTIWGRYISKKKKTHHHHLLCKGNQPMNFDAPWNLQACGDSLDINCRIYLDSKNYR